MPACFRCGSPTRLFDQGRPICPKCSDEQDEQANINVPRKESQPETTPLHSADSKTAAN